MANGIHTNRALAILENRTRASSQAETVVEVLQQLCLPFWDESERASPNCITRSALFSAQRFDKNRNREFLVNIKLYSFSDLSIVYNGLELDQADSDVLEAIFHLFRGQDMNKPLIVSIAKFFKTLGKTSGGAMTRDVLARMVRLRSSVLTIKQGQFSYFGGLIDEGAIDEKTKKIMLKINPRIISLFQPDQFTKINWDIKKDLVKQPIALFLYRFYATHAKPLPLKIETIHQLCRSQAKNMRDFRRNVEKALLKIEEVCLKNGEVFKGEIKEDGLVYVNKTGSTSQQKHLIKKDFKKNGNPNARFIRHSTPQQLNFDMKD